jgi:hypothetical protein
MVRDVQAFMRRLNVAYPDIPWLYAPELHPGGHGWHVHFGVDRYISQRKLARLWGHGFVDIRKLRTGKGGREDARAAARYLAKYVTKARELEPGAHGYEVRQGHQPEVVRVRAWGLAPLREVLVREWGEPAYEWSSDSEEQWRGPPAAFLSW